MIGSLLSGSWVNFLIDSKVNRNYVLDTLISGFWVDSLIQQ